jgi:hypothetical protein
LTSALTGVCGPGLVMEPPIMLYSDLVLMLKLLCFYIYLSIGTIGFGVPNTYY